MVQSLLKFDMSSFASAFGDTEITGWIGYLRVGVLGGLQVNARSECQWKGFLRFCSSEMSLLHPLPCG
jgi:hypothetical protein